MNGKRSLNEYLTWYSHVAEAVRNAEAHETKAGATDLDRRFTREVRTLRDYLIERIQEKTRKNED